METRIKFFGHPIHPILIVYPLGLLSMTVLFDIVYVITGNTDLATFAFWANLIGVIGGLAAAVFGFYDFLGLPSDTRARRIAMIHGGGNLVVVILFLLSLILRWNDHAYLPSVAPMVPGLIGGILAVGTAWLGGELVYRLGVGVDEDSDLDAENSLTKDGALQVQDMPPRHHHGLSHGPGAKAIDSFEPSTGHDTSPR